MAGYFGGKAKSEEFTESNASWDIPDGVEWLGFILVGGGGGGGGGASDKPGNGGGGGGGQVRTGVIKVDPDTALNISIGGGGSGGAAETDGNDGTESTISQGGTTLVTALPGKKGLLSDDYNSGRGGLGGGQIKRGIGPTGSAGGAQGGQGGRLPAIVTKLLILVQGMV